MYCILCSIPFAQDWLSIIDSIFTLVGLILTFYIAIIISRKLDSERTLKNHFIEEVKTIREHEESIFQYIISNNIQPQKLKSMLGNLNTNVSDLMSLLKSQYGMDDSYLDAFQWKYSQLFTDDEDFTSNYKGDVEFHFKQQLLKDFTNYRTDKLRLFNDLIVLINNSKSKNKKSK